MVSLRSDGLAKPAQHHQLTAESRRVPQETIATVRYLPTPVAQCFPTLLGPFSQFHTSASAQSRPCGGPRRGPQMVTHTQHLPMLNHLHELPPLFSCAPDPNRAANTIKLSAAISNCGRKLTMSGVAADNTLYTNSFNEDDLTAILKGLGDWHIFFQAFALCCACVRARASVRAWMRVCVCVCVCACVCARARGCVRAGGRARACVIYNDLQASSAAEKICFALCPHGAGGLPSLR